MRVALVIPQENIDTIPAFCRVASKVRGHVATTSKLIDSTIETARRISSDLRPPNLDDLGLAPAIEWQAQQFEAAPALHVMLTHSCTTAGT